MLLQVKLTHFFSIGEEINLELVAGKIKIDQRSPLVNNVFKYDNIEVLKTIALFGANASGKTNILKFIRLGIKLICNSFKDESIIADFHPFKSARFLKKPSNFYIRFVVHGTEYDYLFSLNKNQVLKESLYYYPKGRRAKIFVRDESLGNSIKEKYSFGRAIIKRPYEVAENTTEKMLYLSSAGEMEKELPKKILAFFSNNFVVNLPSDSEFTRLACIYKNELMELLKLADSGIIDIKIINNNQESIEIKFFHRFLPDIAFSFGEESFGIQKLIVLLLTIIDAIRHNKTCLLDNIEIGLHPYLIDFIIKVFHFGTTAQMIFSTNNTTLLNLEKLRKDQIWFVNTTANGSSDLYSLYDYVDDVDTWDLEKAYLQGRFDAVPIIDDTVERFESILKSKNY